MKSKLLLAIIFALPLAFASCSKKDGTANNGASDDYPLKDCVVSGEPLGSMGEPYVLDHKGTTVKFCCKNCKGKFEKMDASAKSAAVAKAAK